MARIGPPAIYEAAAHWKEKCLLQDRSVFLEDARVWTKEHAAELHRRFIDEFDASERTFFEKFKDQLHPTSIGAKRLAAEMMWVMSLFPNNISHSKKLENVTQVWEWTGEELDAELPLLAAPLVEGIGSSGRAYNTRRPFELTFFIHLVSAIKKKPAAERADLLADPWSASEWMSTLPNSGTAQLRHMLLHLLFPASFERIASGADRRAVAAAFEGLVTIAQAPASTDPLTALDQRLLSIRRALERQASGRQVDFYESPWAERWKQTGDSPPPARKRVWAVGAGEGATRWPEFFDNGYIAIGLDDIGDLSSFNSMDEARDAIIRVYGRRNPVNDALAAWQIVHDVKIGDEVFVKQGMGRILGYGIVEGDYEYEAKAPDYKNRRRVNWLAKGNWELPSAARLPVKGLTDITAYPAFEQFMRPVLQALPPVGTRQYSVDDAMRDVFLGRPEFERILHSLRRRKNVILQGSPGVGKSFLARRLAWALIGARTDDQVQMVQFHQSYAYEDFIQGWRPNGKEGFAMRNGVFHDFCRRAREHPDRPHVFIIDEINRGNLSKVFGELLLLIEADKRGPEFAIPLTYSESATDTFYVPENVYLVGLMNTADRSLAMVDYALRRRFAFITLAPAFASPSFRQTLRERGVPDRIIDRIVERVGRVNEDIRSDAKNLGPGFEIGHSYFCPTVEVGDPEAWYRAVVQEEIHPLLEEYWFDEPERVARSMTALDT